MIRSFQHKGLRELFLTGRSPKVRADLWERCLKRLDALDHARSLHDLHVPGFDFHSLHGRVQRFTVHVNGPWCITFEWHEGEPWRVDLEQYH
jgi:proteic killer suppression protein